MCMQKEFLTKIMVFVARLHKHSEYLNSARPTAVNLSWTLSRKIQW